jgi:hypothetical protein
MVKLKKIITFIWRLRKKIRNQNNKDQIVNIIPSFELNDEIKNQ